MRVFVTPLSFAAPLMTVRSLSQLDVVELRLERTALSGALQSNLSFIIIKADLTPPPPIALADPSLEIVQPVVLLRAGVFGFRDLVVYANETDEEVTVWVDRVGSSFGVAVVQFSTVDGTARVDLGGYTPVEGVLQYEPYVTSLVCCL